MKKKQKRKRATGGAGRRWSRRVTERSDALDLQGGVFTLNDPKAIARSLKRSAERSHRRKSAPLRSAMSMLTFYINRGGRELPARRRKVLDQAKDELRRLYGRDGASPGRATKKKKKKATRRRTAKRSARRHAR